ncbi:hypothetical protein [Paraburkholderia rhizosphaerae]|uniref:Uncharacterized protein n=1 Tax=Paraburkholderia rhizosphaerae TaxID=480658 RepID=A0A4R8LY60_9BURK|nr:hypothetical protein [Paraburkholderia rhizosphaerae]TDY51727.1 hypothetical protein BX592_10621 [Paraburkholderia rhizosphaerae]
MLYLKNTLGGLSRSLIDSALLNFQKPYRWWKLALFAVVFVLPGGSLGVLFLAWIDHRRTRRGSKTASVKPVAVLVATSVKAKAPSAIKSIAPGAAICQSRPDAPACRAAAGKQARQVSSDARV